LNVAKKSRRGNTGPAKIVEVWETLATAVRKLRRSAAAACAQRNINKENEFRGAFDSNLTASGAGM
jgi:hypothetical protein